MCVCGMRYARDSEFLLGAVPLSLLFLFAFIFVNGNFYKQSNHLKENEEIKTNWRGNIMIAIFI